MRRSLRASICEGAREAIIQALVADEGPDGLQMATEVWYDSATAQEWRGTRVRRECLRINALLQEYLGQIERGEVP